jgi:valyl-tRNA synthetase
MTELAKAYDPKGVEDRWYAFWEEQGYFIGPTGAPGDPFSIVIPPPNVTGVLHMGHALNNTLQDILVRRVRMQGRPTLWVPGTDHAGIGTHVVVEQRLAEEGLTRYDLGREKFLERTWAWKDDYEARMLNQLRRLGASVDWTRTRFTLDEGLSRAVRKVFVQLYDEGHIYRGYRIINWCPRCGTALSDAEVKHRDIAGELVTLRYPLTDGSGSVSVSTTRVETMLGDTAVAVHPDDERYRSLVGTSVTLPLVGREIPIVADDSVDPSFGTGAVKVTPAHDPNDFEIGQRHGLAQINIFDKEAVVNENGGRFEGLPRYEARKAVLEALRAEGAVDHEERPYVHSVGHCDRCDTEIEPWLSEQWFVAMKELAKPAIEAVRSGRVRIVPEQPFSKQYLDWLENIRDWCISRQLWWGHRIPVWYCENGHRFAALEDPTACADCGSEAIEQDPDVLDTWFSSQLWPFSTLGWPESTDDLAYWYPTDVLVTAYEILYLWVVRMVVAGVHFMGTEPFTDVVIHGIVRDFEGKKMSKSKGNAIDPLELMDRYGTDAMRFSLARSAVPGQDTNVAEEWIEGDRRFVNKLWNATRFALPHIGSDLPEPPPTEPALPEAWILSRLETTRASVDAALESYEFADAAKTLYQFVWSEFCDWYLEMAKLGMDAEHAPAVRSTLYEVLETVLRLMHPFMPFVSEELWQKLPRRAGSADSIMVSPWPIPSDGRIDLGAEAEMAFLQEIVVEVRRYRHEHGIAPRERIDAVVAGEADRTATALAHSDELKALASISELRAGDRPDGWSRVVAGGVDVYLPLPETDREAERERLQKDIAEADKLAERAGSKLSNDGFTKGAPADVVAKVRAQLAEHSERAARLRAQLEDLRN